RIDVDFALLRKGEKTLPEAQPAADAQVELAEPELAAPAGPQLVMHGRTAARSQTEDELLGRGLELLRDVVANPGGPRLEAEVADVQRHAVVLLQRGDAGHFALDAEGLLAWQRQQVGQRHGDDHRIKHQDHWPNG